MPISFTRLCASLLTVSFALACLASFATAEDGYKQPPIPPPVPQWKYPDKTALERMQMSLDGYRSLRILERSLAGEKIKFYKLEVTSEPEGADVLVNSYIPLGKTPFSDDHLLKGNYRVTVRKDGYYEQVRMVDITPFRTATTHFKLQPILYAHLTVQVVPKDAKVSLIGVEAQYKPQMKLEPGDYLVRVSHPKYGEHRLWAVLGANENLTLTADLKAGPGKIQVTSKQPGTTVYLDGEEAGSAPLTISGLLHGPHKLQVWKSLFKPTTTPVKVKSGETVAEDIDLAPAEHFTNSLGMEFVKIPAGSFMMGFRDSPEVVAARIAEFYKDGFVIEVDKSYLPHNLVSTLVDQYPRHLVVISRPFFMQTTEVMREQWRQMMGENAYCDFKYPNRPVLVQFLREVKDFIDALNLRDRGRIKYRLPTEAEWEYAARAGTTSPYFTGETLRPDQAAYNECNRFAKGYKGPSRKAYSKVKSFPPNPWGLYDTMGNTYETCVDDYDLFFYSRSPIEDPVCIGAYFPAKVERGGLLILNPECCCSAYRAPFDPGVDTIGQRLGMRLIAEQVN